MAEDRIPLFSGFGVELEYMLVDRTTYAVAPEAEALLTAVAGEPVAEVEIGDMAWSNELVRHVIELKTNRPAPSLAGLPERFQAQVAHANALLAPDGRQLMPGAMHPWMDPAAETHLWLHEYAEVYAAFDRIFGCSGHGWSNLQSTHLNLPFSSDQEFGRLHAAIRLLLPILPALAASSPFADGRFSGFLDARLVAYRDNSRRIPSVSGRVIPEAVFSEDNYQSQILAPMYRDIAAYDPEGILQHEWLNARGAIARFDRGTIEIRLLDVQECPLADIAILELLVAVLRGLTEERWSAVGNQQAQAVAPLARILAATTRDAEQAAIDDPEYLGALGLAPQPTQAGDVWRALAARDLPSSTQDESWRGALDTILSAGPLARRMLRRAGTLPTRETLQGLAGEMCACLAHGRLLSE